MYRSMCRRERELALSVDRPAKGSRAPTPSRPLTTRETLIHPSIWTSSRNSNRPMRSSLSSSKTFLVFATRNT